MKVRVGISNRHMHLSEEDFKVLFGDTEIINERELDQPGQYATNLSATIKTEKAELTRVRFLSPFRPHSQVEISRTDSYKLGLNPPVRDSGDLAGSAPITIVGPNGEVNLKEGCIIAARHLHISTEERKEAGLEDVSVVKAVVGGKKGGILDNVVVKSADTFAKSLHLDTDDGNANLLVSGDEVEIVK